MKKLVAPLITRYCQHKTKRCAFFKVTARKPIQNDLAAMINKRTAICDQFKFVYYSFPKCANTTVHIMLALGAGMVSRSSFLGLTPEAQHELGNGIKRREVGAFKNPIDLDGSQANLLSDYFSFAISRNPYTRIASGFFDKIQRKKVTDVHNAMRRPITATVTFDDFVDYLLDGGVHERDYWVPQSKLLPAEKKDLSFVGKFENLNEDLTIVSDKIFGAPPFLHKPVTHSTKRQQARTPLFSDRTAEAIISLYADDFTEFEYDLALPAGV